jgi:hypothetical protein
MKDCARLINLGLLDGPAFKSWWVFVWLKHLSKGYNNLLWAICRLSRSPYLVLPLSMGLPHVTLAPCCTLFHTNPSKRPPRGNILICTLNIWMGSLTTDVVTWPQPPTHFRSFSLGGFWKTCKKGDDCAVVKFANFFVFSLTFH